MVPRGDAAVLVSPDAPTQAATAYGLYARVSSHDQKDDLGRQVARLTAWAADAGFAAHGCRLGVIDDGEVHDDLVQDMVEVLTLFCARLYGRRSARNRALKAVGCAQHHIGPAAVVGAVGQGGES